MTVAHATCPPLQGRRQTDWRFRWWTFRRRRRTKDVTWSDGLVLAAVGAVFVVYLLAPIRGVPTESSWMDGKDTVGLSHWTAGFDLCSKDKTRVQIRSADSAAIGTINNDVTSGGRVLFDDVIIRRIVSGDVHLSFTRDGAVWARFGTDQLAADWTFVDEPRLQTQISLLDSDVIRFLENVNYTDSCALTDLDLSISAEHGWHPSYVVAFDQRSKQTNTLLLRPSKDCLTNTTVWLAADKQRLICDGGIRSGCGQRNLPGRGQSSSRMFIKSVDLDPLGKDHWLCAEGAVHNDYTLYGSFYHAYVKLAACDIPHVSRRLGHEIKMRPNKDEETWSNMVLLPDPLHGAISDGVVASWSIFVKIISVQHDVILQIWRPVHLAAVEVSNARSVLLADSEKEDFSYYALVGETFVSPSELRHVDVYATPQIPVLAGDILGIYFPGFNPIGWSSVPCARPEQRYKYYIPNVATSSTPSSQSESPSRAGVVVGKTYRFTRGTDDATACRQYSLAAIFANRSDAPAIDDWICPTSSISSSVHSPMLPRRGINVGGGRDSPENQNDAHWTSAGSYLRDRGEVLPTVRPPNQPKRSGTPTPAVASVASTPDDTLPIHLLLITVAVLLVLLILVGILSYYRAVGRRVSLASECGDVIRPIDGANNLNHVPMIRCRKNEPIYSGIQPPTVMPTLRVSS